MKGPTVTELTPNQTITSIYLVHNKEVRQKTSGEPYLSLVLGDRTGEIDAKMWDNVSEIADTFGRDDFVRVKGETLVYNNRLQLRVHRVARVADSEVDLADFLPVSKRDPEEMFAELMAAVRAMKDPWLRQLLEAVLGDPEIAAAYKKAPAAKAIHHAWLGGLLEHVLSLILLARDAARHYPIVDQDLLLTGVVLHDIGKISELSYERSFSYSSEGQLIGHILIGLRIVGEKASAIPGFPPKLRLLVEHMILSHHGQLEFGSPKVPLFAEALLLHHLDNMDSKMEALRAALERDQANPGEWTAYNHALERPLLNKDRYLSSAPAAKAPAKKPKAPPPTTFGAQLFDALKKDE